MLLMAGAGAAAEGPTLHITAEHSPPANMLIDGKVAGREGDKIHTLLTRAGVSYQISILPWKRAYTMARQNPDTCVYSTSRTPEREAQFKWVGPTDEAQWVLMGRADRQYQLQSLEDARTLRIGTYHGDARDEYLRRRGFLVDPAQQDASNPKKLLLNRIDLWAVGMRNGALGDLALHVAPGLIVPVLTFHHVKVYLACHPSVPDALIDRLNQELDAMRKDGTFTTLEKKYEHWAERQ